MILPAINLLCEEGTEGMTIDLSPWNEVSDATRLWYALNHDFLLLSRWTIISVTLFFNKSLLAEEMFTKDIIIRGEILYKRYHVSDTCQMISAKEKNF